MRYEEYLLTASEISQLEDLLDRMPEERVIERMGLESQLKRARSKIDGVDPPAPPRKARLSVRGAPVQAGSGIEANFGAKTMALFSDAITVTAAGLAGYLGNYGRIPNRHLYQPVLTKTSSGSFAFIMELPVTGTSTQPGSATEGFASEALTKVQDLLELASSQAGEGLVELAREIHPRGIRKIQDLLDLMHRNGAWFALDSEERQFQFADSGQVAICANLLRSIDLHEDAETITGTLRSLVFASRRFEIIRYPSDEIVEGTIGPEVRDDWEFLEQHVGSLVQAHITWIRFREATPQYTLRRVELAEQAF